MTKRKIALYNPYLETKGGGEKVCLALAAALSTNKDNEVFLLTHEEVDVAALGKYFDIDLSAVKTRYIYTNDKISRLLGRLPLPGKLRNFFFDVRVLGKIKKHRYDVFVNNCYQSNLPNPSPLGIYMCMFPQKLRQTENIRLLKRIYFLGVDILYKIFLHPGHKTGVFSYQLITANSRYTQEYIEDYWRFTDSQILYPICDDMSVAGAKKKKVILNVGRFFEKSGENHHKRQDFLLKTFKEMPDLHKDGWELHFAGSVAEDAGALKFILGLIKEARGFPIFFHFDCSFDEIRNLYNESTIYWHATGYDSPVAAHPEKQEHFGISTVEAMSARSIPVVINRAGQKESVVNNENGFLWSNEKELMELTRKVARLDEKALKALQSNARKTAKTFDKQAFNARAVELLASITR